MTDEELSKMRKCAPLLPPPGDEVVLTLLDEIQRLSAELIRVKAENQRLVNKGEHDCSWIKEFEHDGVVNMISSKNGE
jgi:hypothetical protein